MIEFRGEISESCKKYIIKKESKSYLISLIFSLIISIPLIVLTFVINWVFILGLIPLFVLVLVSLIPPKGKTLDLIIPQSIYINNGYITCKGKNFCCSNQILYVKKVIDMGGWYHIFFRFPHKSFRYVCQKNLLIDGSIEEFENLFQGKIIKTNKKSYLYF